MHLRQQEGYILLPGEQCKLLYTDILHLPILELILLFGELALHLLQLHRVLLDRLRLLVDLLLERARDFHHFRVVLADSLAGTVHVLLQILQAERPLIETNVQRGDIAVNKKARVRRPIVKNNVQMAPEKLIMKSR